MCGRACLKSHAYFLCKKGGFIISDYWKDRMQAAQDNLTEKNIEDINKQILKYYKLSHERVIDAFIDTYNTILTAEVFQDRMPTPADLYNLDKYWQMQGMLQQELQKLGDKQAAVIAKRFEKQFFDIYKAALPAELTYTLPAKDMVTQMVNQVWAADGVSWKQRIWKNLDLLKETLNEELVSCVVTGRDSKYLKNILQERFEVSYGRADTLVRTELAHIQTTAAQQRYIDAGVAEVEVWASEDERRCPDCGKIHKKKYPIHGQMPIPVHPKCRCCIIPVVDMSKFKDL